MRFTFCVILIITTCDDGTEEQHESRILEPVNQTCTIVNEEDNKVLEFNYIFSVVGGVIALLAFVNSSLSQSSIRFLSVSIGKSDVNDTRSVFNNCFI